MKALLFRACRAAVLAVLAGIERRFPRWNPDAAWRYLPIARTIRKVIGPHGSVLDVGAGAEGIAPYLSNPMILSDLAPPLADPAAPFVQASGTHLPFPDASFDGVVSADSLEHVPGPLREEVIGEMFRVARRIVVIAVPAGPAAEAHDRALHEYSAPDSGFRIFLDEHIRHGLPSPEELVGTVHRAAAARFHAVQCRVYQNASLGLRARMMRALMSPNARVAFIAYRFWTVVMPVLSRLGTRRGYRIVVACWEGEPGGTGRLPVSAGPS